MAEKDRSTEDAAFLKFGAELDDAVFLPNATVAILLSALKKPDVAYPPAVDSALEYARRFKGAVQVDTPAVIDEVFASLSALEFQRDETEGGPPPPDPPRLVEYEKVALANLNPGTVAAAKSLVPSLERLLDSEVETALVVLRRASARGE